MIPKKAFILLNGAEPSVFPDLTMYDFVCAIDGAYNHFEKNNILFISFRFIFFHN